MFKSTCKISLCEVLKGGGWRGGKREEARERKRDELHMLCFMSV